MARAKHPTAKWATETKRGGATSNEGERKIAQSYGITTYGITVKKGWKPFSIREKLLASQDLESSLFTYLTQPASTTWVLHWCRLEEKGAAIAVGGRMCRKEVHRLNR